MFHVKRCVGIKSFSDAKWMKKRAACKIKSFLIQQFFKNVGEVWASSPHLRSKLKLHNERKQKSKRESEESQLPLKSEGCNEIQGFRGNCDSQASWGCAPALPNRMQVVSLRIIIFNHEPQANKKFFDPAIFQKCWRGSGRVALIAARRQRNSCAMLLAHGEGGEKSDRFSRRGEQDRSAL